MELILLAFGPVAIIAIIAIVIFIALLRKNKGKDTSKLSLILAIIAFILGAVFIVLEYLPLDELYDGPQGIDGIGNAIVFGIIINSIRYSSLGLYISAAIMATVFAIKGMKYGKGKNTISLVLSWIVAVVCTVIIVTNAVGYHRMLNNIKVEMLGTAFTADAGNDYLLVSYRFTNNTDIDKYPYMTAFSESYQNGDHLYDEYVDGAKTPAYDKVKPGESVEYTVSYKLKDRTTPIEVDVHGGSNHVYIKDTIVPDFG